MLIEISFPLFVINKTTFESIIQIEKFYIEFNSMNWSDLETLAGALDIIF